MDHDHDFHQADEVRLLSSSFVLEQSEIALTAYGESAGPSITTFQL
jgi:hypothetical protein